MKTALSLFALLIGSSQAFGAMSHEDIVIQLEEPGHFPQDVPIALYQKLEKVIPPETQAKLKKEKRIRKTQVKAFDDLFKDHPNGVDFTAFNEPIVRQWNGTCTAHGAAAAVENTLNRDGKHDKLSERALWSTYRQYSSVAAMDSLLKFPLVSDAAWPHEKARKPVGFHFEKDKSAKVFNVQYLGSDPKKAAQALLKGYAVNAATSVPRDMAACRAAIRPGAGSVDGGHAYALMAVHPYGEGRFYFTLKQSWGAQCGDQGLQYLPAAYCELPESFCMFWAIVKADRYLK